MGTIEGESLVLQLITFNKMTLQPSYNLEDCKSQIMSAQKEISGELVPVAQYMVLGYESRIETYKTEIDGYKDNIKKSKLTAICAVITAIGAITAALIALYNTQWKINTESYISIEKEFSDALKAVESTDNNKVIDAIGVIERRKDEIFKREPQKQWLTVFTIARVIKNNSIINISRPVEYGSISKDNIQRLINIIKFEDTKGVNFNIKGRPADNTGIIDLSNTYLYNIDLSKAKLPRTNFNHSVLNRAYLNDAELEGSFFTGTQLRNADMSRANLAGASLYDKSGQTKTNLIGTVITSANLTNSKLRGARLFNKKEKKLESFDRIADACNWYRAEYDREVSDRLKQSERGKISDRREECQKF